MKKYKIVALILAVLVLFSGCKKPPEEMLYVEAVYPAKSDGYSSSLKHEEPIDFYKSITPTLLSYGNDNCVTSPFSLYIALSMLAECTEGDSQKQLLNILGSDTLQNNTKMAYDLFAASNVKDTKFATSLWLDAEVTPTDQLSQTLSTKLMTSLYTADFADDSTKTKIAEWINKNTDNLLQSATKDLQFDANTFMAILSTVYFDGKWKSAFKKDNTAPDTFFAKTGEVTADFMNETSEYGLVYEFSDSTAVTKRFSNGCEMAFILPNEDKTPADVINNGEFYNFLTDETYYESYEINLSVPKFDITTDTDFIEGIKSLGITDIFSEQTSDFTPLGLKNKGYINKMQQMNRITVSEDGVKAASGITIGGSLKGEAPVLEKIDFKLNRPFVFMVMVGSVPLFVGTVANPTK